MGTTEIVIALNKLNNILTLVEQLEMFNVDTEEIIKAINKTKDKIMEG